MRAISLLLLPVDDAISGRVTPPAELAALKEEFRKKTAAQEEAAPYYNINETEFVGSSYLYSLGLYICGQMPSCAVCSVLLDKDRPRQICTRCELAW